MKEEQSVLQDVIGTARPEESKTKKYVRIAVAFAGMALFLAVFVMAAIRKCGA